LRMTLESSTTKHVLILASAFFPEGSFRCSLRRSAR
jgi:hypothetical protein